MLRNHFISMPTKSLTHSCQTCARLFTSSSSLNRHWLRRHSGTLPALKCTKDGCSKAFFSRQDWQRHVDQHDGNATHRYVCAACGKRFTRPSSLNRHKIMNATSCRRSGVDVLVPTSSAMATPTGQRLSTRRDPSSPTQQNASNVSQCHAGPSPPSVIVQAQVALTESSETGFGQSGFGGANDIGEPSTNRSAASEEPISAAPFPPLPSPASASVFVSVPYSALGADALRLSPKEDQAVRKLRGPCRIRYHSDIASLSVFSDILFSRTDLENAWFAAVERGNTEDVEILANIRDLLNIRRDRLNRGRTGLHIAVERRDLDTLAQLLRKPQIALDLIADEPCNDQFSDTPLALAMRYKSSASIALLLEAGADVHAAITQNGETTTPLRMSMEACRLPGDGRWFDAELQTLQLQLARVMLLHIKSHGLGLQGTPLIPLADAIGCTDMVELLLDFGAGINAPDFKGRAALHHTCERDDPETTEVLLRRGANINAKDIGGHTPLHLACFFGNSTDPLQRLLEYGADVDALDPRGETALNFACYEGMPDHVKILLHHGADATAKHSDGSTPLHHLAYSRVEVRENVVNIIMQDLVRHGANVDARAVHGTPLLYAVKYFLPGGSVYSTDDFSLYSRRIKALVEAGASLNTLDSVGKTVLDEVLQAMTRPQYREVLSQDPSFFPDLIKYLLERGAMSGWQIEAAGELEEGAGTFDDEDDRSNATT